MARLVLPPWPPNLRSRGDGPTAVHAFAILANKPPLTRRWTYANATVDCSTLQTSAHAEMDRILISCMKRVVANLRSRGDGPASGHDLGIVSVKPPLTRRWTYSMMLLMPKNHQTSAHAEMDPTRRWPEPSRQANLRSRGDGPPKNQSGSLVASKPPLTRRWTGKG